MKCLNDVVEQAESIIDLARSLMVWASLMPEDRKTELSAIMADNALVLKEIANEARSYIPEREEEAPCESCRL
ncbi:MAG: hypothetical protein ACI4WT_03125 [Oligosphaeraceae bacterium]